MLRRYMYMRLTLAMSAAQHEHTVLYLQKGYHAVNISVEPAAAVTLNVI